MLFSKLTKHLPQIMKKLIYIFLLLPILTFGQVPQGFTYQAVATDNNGLELVEQNVSVRVSILSESSTGVEQWIEVHSTTTDGFGLFTITIGEGTSTGNGVQSSFSDIDWGGSEHYLKIEMDVNGSSEYQLLGTSQLMSVPYALHAGTSDQGDSQSEQIDSLETVLQELSTYINSSSSYSSMTEYSIDADSIIELATGPAYVGYSTLTDDSYYVLFKWLQESEVYGVETNSSYMHSLVRYDLDGNVQWSKNTNSHTDYSNSINSNKLRIIESDNFTFILEESISNNGTFEDVGANTCSAIFKYDKNSGEYLDSYVVNSVSNCHTYKDAFYFDEHLYILYPQSNFLNIKKVDQDFSNEEIIETEIGIQYQQSIKVEVDYVNSLMILGVRSHLGCNGSSSINQCMAQIYVYPLPLTESLTPISTISLSSNDVEPIYSVSQNSIYVIETITNDKFVIYEYNKFTGDIIAQDQYHTTMSQSIGESFLTSNSSINSLRVYLQTNDAQFYLASISSNFFHINSSYPIQVDIAEGSLQPIDVSIIKGKIVSRCSYNNTIYSIVKVSEDSYGYLTPAVINDQLYGGNKLILIKDTF